MILIYLQALLYSFLINVIPAFMPPTWLFLSLFKVNNPEVDITLLSLIGVAGSVIGKTITYYYSRFFKKYLPKQGKQNIKLLEKYEKYINVNWKLFLLTFIFSLGPIPSSFIFIISGLTGIKFIPLMLGFAAGRFVSYAVLSSAFYTGFTALSNFIDVNLLRLIIDIAGIIIIIAIIFIKWKNNKE